MRENCLRVPLCSTGKFSKLVFGIANLSFLEKILDRKEFSQYALMLFYQKRNLKNLSNGAIAKVQYQFSFRRKSLYHSQKTMPLRIPWQYFTLF